MTYATYPQDRLGITNPEDWTVEILDRVPDKGGTEWLTFTCSYQGGERVKVERAPFEEGTQIKYIKMWLANMDDVLPLSEGMNVLTKEAARAIADGLKQCPFCGKKLVASIRGSGVNASNPSAKCVTEDCMGSKLPVICLDVPSQVDAWNTRATN